MATSVAPASYLSCPFCPAQAYPLPPSAMERALGKVLKNLVMYRCPSNHEYYVKQNTARPGEDVC